MKKKLLFLLVFSFTIHTCFITASCWYTACTSCFIMMVYPCNICPLWDCLDWDYIFFFLLVCRLLYPFLKHWKKKKKKVWINGQTSSNWAQNSPIKRFLYARRSSTFGSAVGDPEPINFSLPRGCFIEVTARRWCTRWGAIQYCSVAALITAINGYNASSVE